MVGGSGSNASGRAHLGGVESLRAYAAFAIVIFHVIHLTQAPVPTSLEFMKSFFGFGVPLFFVVSAFSLAYGYEGRLFGKGQLKEFYLRRVMRIAPLYYFATATWLLAIAVVGYDQPGAKMLALSLSFLFNLTPSTVDGVTPASWSIGVEMLFYLIFPFVLALASTLPRAIMVTGALTAAALAYAAIVSKIEVNHSFLVHGLIFNLPYFGFGLIAFKLYQVMDARRGILVTAAGFALLVGFWMASGPFGRIGWAVGIIYILCWGAPFALICLGMAQRPLAILSNPITEFLGKISFGLYLGHPQLIFLLTRLGVYERIQQLPGGSGVTFPLAVLVTSAVLIPLAWALYILVERPGIELGRRWAQNLRPGRLQPASAASNA